MKALRKVCARYCDRKLIFSDSNLKLWCTHFYTNVQLLCRQFSNYQLHVVNVVYNIIRNNSGDFSVDFVVDIVNLFLIPLLRISNSDTVINFYSAEFHFLLESLKSTEQNYTTSEKVCFMDIVIRVSHFPYTVEIKSLCPAKSATPDFIQYCNKKKTACFGKPLNHC